MTSETESARLFDPLEPAAGDTPEQVQDQIREYLNSVRQVSQRGSQELELLAARITSTLGTLPGDDPDATARWITEPLRQAVEVYADAARLAALTWQRVNEDPTGAHDAPVLGDTFPYGDGRLDVEQLDATMAPRAADNRPRQRDQVSSGHYNPAQPRAADGKWIKVGDMLGYADDETCFGTDRVTGTGPVPTDLALIEYPADGINQVGAFVSVATPPHGYNPVTGKEDTGHIYCAPQLDATEAETAAGRLEELAEMVESGFKPTTPTKHTRARQRLELLLQENKASRRDRVMVGDGDDFPLTAGDLLKLLSEADPTLSAPQTRHAVRAHAAVAGGGEDGTVWLDVEPDAAGEIHIVVTAVEGTESPDDDYNRQYAARHTPASARELSGKLRAFARDARRRTATTKPTKETAA